jgi:enterobactin synthetase component D
MLETLFTALPINLPNESNEFFTKIALYKYKNNNTYLCICHFDTKAYSKILYDKFSLFFPCQIKNSVKKRQAEFFAGRYAATIALRCLGVDKPNTTIEVGEHGSPIWPKNVRGSITHTQSISACIVSLDCDQHFLGIDIENWLSKELYDQLSSSIINEQEALYIRKSNLLPEKALTITFSAKEALYKAIYPHVKKFLDFHTSTVQEINSRDIKLALSSAYLHAISDDEGKRFICNYVAYEECVLTILMANTN